MGNEFRNTNLMRALFNNLIMTNDVFKKCYNNESLIK